MKQTLAEWQQQHPGRTRMIFGALQDVAPSQPADRDLRPFAALRKEVLSALTPCVGKPSSEALSEETQLTY